MTPEQARTLKAEIASASDEAAALTRGVAAEALVKRPVPESWSAAECLQHLILTAQAMHPLVEGVVARVEKQGARSDEPGRLGFFGWMLTKMLEPPAKSWSKSKTAPGFVPGALDKPLELTAVLRAENDRLLALVDRATGLALGSERVESPFRAGVFYPPYAALRITAVHERRHLWQAREALKGGRGA